MLAVLSLACVAGAACGLARLKVWAIIPASTIFSLIVVILGSYLGLRWGRIALTVFSVLMLLQVSYLVGAVLSDAPKPQRVSGHVPPKQELFRTVRTAIAQELRVHFELVPFDDVPPQLRNKLALLETRRAQPRR